MPACRVFLIPLLLVIAQSANAQLPLSSDTPVCSRQDSSRATVDPKCVNEVKRDSITMPVIQQQPMTIEVTMPVIEPRACGATVSLDYTQSNDFASVNGVVENSTCAASSGSFVVSVSIRDQNGDPQRLEFMQSWQRADDQNVNFTAEYPIGADVDLVRIAAGRMRCSCDTAE